MHVQDRRRFLLNLAGMSLLTYDIRLQSFGHQAACHFQVLWGTLSRLQAKGHSHSLEHLDVIVDLEHAVKVEQVLEPGDRET